MSSGSESDDDYVPEENPVQLSEEESADDETEKQYNNEVEQKKRKAVERNGGKDINNDAIDPCSPPTLTGPVHEAGKWRKRKLGKVEGKGTAASTVGAVTDPKSGASRGAYATAVDEPIEIFIRREMQRWHKSSTLMNKVLTERLEGYVYPGDPALALADALVMNPPILRGCEEGPKPQINAGVEEAPVEAAGTGHDGDGALSVVDGQCGVPWTGQPLTVPVLKETTDGARQAKRQRSTDLVLPSSAAAEKACIVDDAVRRPTEAVKNNHLAGSSSTYVGTALSHLKVVVIEKNGTSMDEIQATLLRKHLEDRWMALFHEDKDKNEMHPPAFKSLPRPAHGGLSAFPCEDKSLKWLVDAVAALPPLWPGSIGLAVVPRHLVANYRKGVLLVPELQSSSTPY